MASRCLYQATARELAQLIPTGNLREVLAERFVAMLGEAPHRSEVASWVNSIPTVVEVLLEAGLGDVQVLVELKTPITDVRMDMVLVGSSPEDGEMSVVVVENKQWSRVWPEPDSELVHAPGVPGPNPRLHPVNQVWGYRQVLRDYVPLLREAKIRCIVNMHEASSDVLTPIQPNVQRLSAFHEMDHSVLLLGSDDRERFKKALQAALSPEKSAHYAEELLEAPVLPTEGLMSAVSKSIRERSVFPLLDEQREACDYVRAMVTKSKKGGQKEVVLIVGGPGTGKSVIAVELLGSLNRQGVRAVHATGSRSFTQTLRDNVGAVNWRARRGFAYFNNFADVVPNDLDVLIADEAHRVRETSRRFQDHSASSRPQVEELIEAARVPVFLLDEHQLVRPGEVGSVELIRKTAARMGIRAHQIDLRHQFRCGGCPEYVDWIERLLGLAPGGPQPWRPVDTFDLYLAQTPSAMENFLRERMKEGYSARIAAGFCWPWSRPRSDGTLANDVKIDDWYRPWNSKAERRINGIPPSSLWATDKAGFGQIGCIYTAQGFEYDYAGVIFGQDLVWTANGWQGDRRANRDSAVNGARYFDQLIRNTYRVLATRGMRGAVLYSTDRHTGSMFARLGVPALPSPRRQY
ncbi:DUF2075 domain-containing protein [Actinoallomurus vinaceus]|uniref:DUF2075 domain-containing protein n=1 Tax=Actinoallomurus vinaceus TaxID=1080074 RepID=A0ABP8UQW4_9ACTN